MGSLHLNTARVGGSQHQVGGADPDVQGSGKTPPAQDSDVFADAQPQRGQATIELGAGVQGEDRSGFARAQRVESVRECLFHG